VSSLWLFQALTRAFDFFFAAFVSFRLPGIINFFFSNSSWYGTFTWYVSNCKERLGPIVTGTLKDRILIAIDISKELALYDGSEYIRFIK